MSKTPPQLTHADHPTWGEVFDERAPILGAPAFFGPPVIYVLGPWLLVALLLIGPFALVFTVALIAAVAAGLLVALLAVIASPYLLIRRFHMHRSIHAEPRRPVHLLRRHRVAPDQLNSLQPKGVS